MCSTGACVQNKDSLYLTDPTTRKHFENTTANTLRDHLKVGVDRCAVDADERRREDLVAVDRLFRARGSGDTNDGDGAAAEADGDINALGDNAEKAQQGRDAWSTCGRR